MNKSIQRHLALIRQVNQEIEKSQSIRLKRDKYKQLTRLKKELQEYCKWNNLNYMEVMNYDR